MEMIYNRNKLYINIDERIDIYLIKKIQRKLYRIIDMYHINDIEINTLNTHYDHSLFDYLLVDYNKRYNGNLIIK